MRQDQHLSDVRNFARIFQNFAGFDCHETSSDENCSDAYRMFEISWEFSKISRDLSPAKPHPIGIGQDLLFPTYLVLCHLDHYRSLYAPICEHLSIFFSNYTFLPPSKRDFSTISKMRKYLVFSCFFS